MFLILIDFYFLIAFLMSNLDSKMDPTPPTSGRRPSSQQPLCDASSQCHLCLSKKEVSVATVEVECQDEETSTNDDGNKYDDINITPTTTIAAAFVPGNDDSQAQSEDEREAGARLNEENGTYLYAHM